MLALAAALVLGLSAWNNVVVHRLPGSPVSYVPANLTAAGVLLAAARGCGLSWAELGLARSRLRAGLRWGGAPAALVASGYAVALVVPGFRPLLRDARVAGADAGEIVYQAVVRIPLGTVVWEEVAFRGVLLAVLRRLLPLRAALGVSAVLFGIWHVRPTIGGLAANDVVEGPLARALVVALLCSGTAVAGLLFGELRLRSGSLLAPALLHLSTNSLGTLAGAAAHRL
jgi:uncharacterized protein